MPNGFGTVPEELRHTAAKIGDVIGNVAAAVWQGPSADYGHAGVQCGYQLFIEEMKSHVESLRDKADGHGRNLATAATSYVDTEADAGAVITQAGQPLEAAGTGFSGGATGFLHSSIAQRLNPADSAGQSAGDQAGPQNGRLFF
jgi:hypothetical protein